MARRRIGFWYRVVVVVVKPLLLLFTKRDWRGMEHIPAQGGFVTAVNHISYVDPLTYAHFQYESGREAHFLAKSSLFKIPVVGRIIKGAGQIPVFRDSADAALAFRAAVDAVNRGDCVAVYPEGTITRDKALWPMSGKTGAARIALTTGAPVIPVAQWGAQEILAPYGKRLRLFPRKTMKVIAGPPVDLDDFRGRDLTAEVLRGATDRIMDAVTELLGKLRDEPVPPRGPGRKAKAAGPAAAANAHAEAEETAVAGTASDTDDGASPDASAATTGESTRETHAEPTGTPVGEPVRAQAKARAGEADDAAPAAAGTPEPAGESAGEAGEARDEAAEAAAGAARRAGEPVGDSAAKEAEDAASTGAGRPARNPGHEPATEPAQAPAGASAAPAGGSSAQAPVRPTAATSRTASGDAPASASASDAASPATGEPVVPSPRADGLAAEGGAA